MAVDFISSPREGRVGFAKLADELDEGLADLKEFGVRTDLPPNSRFSEYSRHLRWMTQRLGSRLELPPPSGQEVHLLVESLIQTKQLLESRVAWRVLSPKRARKKLMVVAGGEVLPPPGDQDKPRDTLLELVVATRLHKLGLELEEPRATEDTHVHVPGLGTVVVETKRPTSMASVSPSLSKAAGQISQHPRDHGMIALGVERVLRLDQRLPAPPNAAVFEANLGEAMSDLWTHIAHYELPEEPLWPTASAVMLVLSTAAVLRDERTVLQLDSTVFAATLPSDDTRADHVREVLQGLTLRAMAPTTE
jgi:hypothetical protein